MKITTITVLKAGEYVTKGRDTQKNKNVETIIDNLRTKEGDLVIAAEDMKKFERYGLQTSLQKAGAKVVVQKGQHAVTKKEVLIIHRLSDKEWKEYVSK